MAAGRRRTCAELQRNYSIGPTLRVHSRRRVSARARMGRKAASQRLALAGRVAKTLDLHRREPNRSPGEGDKLWAFPPEGPMPPKEPNGSAKAPGEKTRRRTSLGHESPTLWPAGPSAAWAARCAQVTSAICRGTTLAIWRGTTQKKGFDRPMLDA